MYLSALAALCYIVATIGFAYRRKWTWWLSVGSLGFETFMTLLIGTWSFVNPDLIGRTVWRHFGEDYGYFPLIQPLIGLVWLLWPITMEAYGIRPKKDRRSRRSRPDRPCSLTCLWPAHLSHPHSPRLLPAGARPTARPCCSRQGPRSWRWPCCCRSPIS